MKKSKGNLIDILFLAIWIILPPVLLLLLHGNFFSSIIVYFVLASIYFSFRTPRIVPKALIAAGATIPFVIIFDYTAFFNKTWAVPTIFPSRFFTFIPFEDFLYTFFAVYLVTVAFYYFFRLEGFAEVNISRLKISSIFILALLAAFLFLYVTGTSFFRIPYYDAWLVFFVFIIPTLILLAYFPSYRKPLMRAIPYVFLLMLPYELTALHLGFWTFPSAEYIAMMHIGHLRFPIEEFLEWMVFFVPASLAFTAFISGGNSQSAKKVFIK